MDKYPAPVLNKDYFFDIGRIIDRFQSHPKPVITVLGDYCLDKYLFIDASQEEISVETGLPAHQVRRKGIFPGAAGTIVNNLSALGAEVRAVGIYGSDGEGYELIRALQERETDISGMICSPGIVTSTYIKPMYEKDGTARELSRLDIRNMNPAPIKAVEQIKKHLDKTLPSSDGIIISDQFTREAGSILAGDLPEFLAQKAVQFPEKFFMADSRSNAARYREILVKCNASEILDLLNRLDHPEIEADVAADKEADEKLDELLHAGRRISEYNRRPLLVTRGSHGSLLFQPNQSPLLIPSIPVPPPIDICGAGDATNAGLTFARTAGLPLPESAIVAAAVSSITIRQLGVTGTATLDEVIQTLGGSCKTVCFR